jgi:multidrug efflux pump subunit AcrA (membrane-fusion protein)
MVGWLRKPVVLIGLVVVVIIAGYFIFRSRTTSTATTKTNTVKVAKGDLTVSVSGSSNIVAESNVTLNFQSAGIVNAILVEEGDSVKKGQQLATIDARDLQYQVASAEAAYKSAQAKLSQLLEGSGRSSDLTSAQAAVTSAQAQLNSAQEKLDALSQTRPLTKSVQPNSKSNKLKQRYRPRVITIRLPKPKLNLICQSTVKV